MIDIFKENRKIVLTNLKTTAQLKSSENSNYLKIINSSLILWIMISPSPI